MSLRERLAGGPVLFDGAVGTELYQRGHFINKPFEGANLSDPRLVEQVQREYVDAGADVVQTNTFASNRAKLTRVGLDDQHDALNRAGVEIARNAAGGRAWVVGTIGPTGEHWPALTRDKADSLCDVFVDQARVLLDAGVDGLILETFSYLSELREALRVIRGLTDLPIIAQAAYVGNGMTADAVAPPDVYDVLAEGGADVIGANCADGPNELYHIAEQLVGRGLPVSVLPNAGYPKRVDGRMIYMATPEYFGVFARRFLKLGVDVVGGCCGTSPDHIRAMAGAVRMMSGGQSTPEVEPQRSDTRPTPAIRVHDPEVAPVPFDDRSSLAKKIAGTDGFVVSVEVNPPTGLDPERAIRGARMLRDAGVDVINIADGPRASVRMSNWSLGLQVREEVGLDCILHVCMRDRNLLGLQSDILAFHSLGLNNLVVITGDPPKMGDYPNATAVFDLDSVGAIRMIRDFNHGLNPAGRSLGGRTEFAIACGAEPAALDYDRELRRLRQKVENGAEFIMTQPVYDPDVLDRFLDDIGDLDVPVLVGLLPLASARNAEFLHNEVPGMQIPDSIRGRMADIGRGPEARAEGVRIAQEALEVVKDRVRGAYIMPPFGRYEAAIEILEVVGYEKPKAWVDDWRH